LITFRQAALTLVVQLIPRGHELVRAVTARRRKEIANVARAMPARERQGLVRALTTFTTAGGEPAAYVEIDDQMY
jgi:hypothetical protein